jgi:hypothetical protein
MDWEKAEIGNMKRAAAAAAPNAYLRIAFDILWSSSCYVPVNREAASAASRFSMGADRESIIASSPRHP